MTKVTPFNYFGGKYYWVDYIYQHFPEHKHFVDVMCGSMVVTLNKEPSLMDTANDVDDTISNFFFVLRNHGEELMDMLRLTPVGRSEYKQAWPIWEQGISRVEWARRFFVRCRQSFQGSGICNTSGFNACVSTTEGGMSKNVAKFRNAIEKLPEVIERLRRIQVENLDYKDLISRYDRPDTFFYIDPPYELRSRNYKKFYTNEFTDKDHEEMAEIVTQAKAKVMISHYDTPMYRRLYKDFRVIALPPKGHSLKGAKKQEEFLFVNYDETKNENNIIPDLFGI